LGLNIGIGSRRLPDAAEVAAPLDNGDAMPARRKSFRRGKPGHTGADDANLLLPDHEIASV
jgi:hypothetical protein